MSRFAPRSPGSPLRPWMGAAAVVATLLLMIVLIAPLREFPIEDDWDYSKTVGNILQTGVFRRLEVTQATVLFPAMWGALWSKVFGYSFATLRVSTLVLACGALMFFYRLLGELEFDAPRRALATLALLVAPAFVYLAFSFMTDVPFLFGLLGALYFYCRAVRQANARLALIGSVFAALAFLARQQGALIPVAFVLFSVSNRAAFRPDGASRSAERRATVKWMLAGAIIPLVVAGAFLAWLQFFGGANWADRTRTLNGTLGFWLKPDTAGVVGRRLVIAAATIGIYTLPVWLGLAPALSNARRGWKTIRRGQQWVMALLAVAFAVVLVRLAMRDQWFPYLTDILTRRGLRPYLAYTAYELDAHRPFIFSLELSAGLSAVAGVLGWILCALIVVRLRPRSSPALACVYWTTAVLAAGSLTFFTYFERYLLPLIPGALIVLLDATRRARLSLAIGVLGVGVVALFSVALMQDYFAWNEARWKEGQALLTSSVPVESLDGGYEWNGWYLYDASMAYIRSHGSEMKIDPWQYVLDPEFLFAFQAPPNYRVVKTLEFATPLRAGGVDRFYLLQRER